MTVLSAILRRSARTLLLLALVATGTILLMRFSPGYLSDIREMDAKYAHAAQSDLASEQAEHGTLRQIASTTLGGWFHGNLGQSRQYEVPVADLLRPRLAVTALLLARGIGWGWILAFSTALPLSAASTLSARSLPRHTSALLSTPFTLLLAIPVGAMATLCLLGNTGGPVLVLALILAARDFKFLHRAFTTAWGAPHLLHARAGGLRLHQLTRRYLLPNVAPQVLALATLSLVTALSALVPVEVLFDIPGIGQLAWNAALNRDLPVLMTITLLMAAAVSAATALSTESHPAKIA